MISNLTAVAIAVASLCSTSSPLPLVKKEMEVIVKKEQNFLHSTYQKPDINMARLEEEERIAVKLLREIARIYEILLSKKEPSSSELCVDKEKVLKVSWGKTGENYSCQRLKELFSDFGEHVIISKKKRYALVEMSSKDEAAIAASCVLEDLLIVPLQTPSPL